MNKYIIVILLAWYMKAFSDAIRFAKGGEDCYEIWHIAEWVRFWIPVFLFMWLVKMPWIQIIIIIIGSFGFNFFYRLFRYLNVYKLDNLYRCKWLEKILKPGGII